MLINLDSDNFNVATASAGGHNILILPPPRFTPYAACRRLFVSHSSGADSNPWSLLVDLGDAGTNQLPRSALAVPDRVHFRPTCPTHDAAGSSSATIGAPTSRGREHRPTRACVHPSAPA